eukprot:scaffold3000_cov97-Skeletonema_menzelii.AAC.1
MSAIASLLSLNVVDAVDDLINNRGEYNIISEHYQEEGRSVCDGDLLQRLLSVEVKSRYTYEDDGVERTIHSKKNGRKFIKGHFRSKSRVHIEIGIRYRNYVLIPMLGVMSVFDGGMHATVANPPPRAIEPTTPSSLCRSMITVVQRKWERKWEQK